MKLEQVRTIAQIGLPIVATVLGVGGMYTGVSAKQEMAEMKQANAGPQFPPKIECEIKGKIQAEVKGELMYPKK